MASTITLTKKELQEIYKKYTIENSTEFPVKKGKIRMMTFNVHLWQDYLEIDAVDNIFKIISDSNADIIGLNEGLFFSKGLIKKVKNYISSLGYTYYVDCNSKYGINLLISKFPIKSHKIINLGKDPIKNLSRYAIKATISIESIEINILVTHLDVFDETEETRLKQMQIIFNEIDETYILLGDLNSLRKKDYDKTEWKDLKIESENRKIKIQHKVTTFIENNKFTDCFVKMNQSCPKVSVWSMRRVDYIYIGDLCPITVKQCGIYPTISSDHYPIFIDF